MGRWGLEITQYDTFRIGIFSFKNTIGEDMEIPLDNVTKQIHENDMKIIKDQAREIRELQMTIVRLREEMQKQYEENQKWFLVMNI